MQPPQSTDVKLQGPLMDLISRYGELSTAWSAYSVWNIVVSKDLFPRICECVFGSSVLVIEVFAEGLNFVWTAWIGDATQIGIAITLDELGSQ